MTSFLKTVPSWTVASSPPEGSLAELPAWQKSMATVDAIRLIQLGARAGLVRQLTGVDKSTANSLYRHIHGRPSPPGLAPFTDTWYLRSDPHMLHAAFIWRLHKRLSEPGGNPARALIDVYEIFPFILPENRFDIIHAAFVPRLVEMKLWHERACIRCATIYITALEESGTICPGCKLHQRYRCQNCGAPAAGYRKGRRRAVCPRCGAQRLR